MQQYIVSGAAEPGGGAMGHVPHHVF
jgi:hypothetical protein